MSWLLEIGPEQYAVRSERSAHYHGRPMATAASTLTAQERLAGIAERLMATRRSRLTTAFVVLVVLTFLWNLPIALHPASEILGGPGDGTLSVRQNWAATVQGGSVFSATRDQLNGAPEGVPLLAATEWAQPAQVVFLLVLHYATGWLAAWNVFVMAGFLLTGWFAFLLLDDLGFHPFASFFGAYVLAFNPWMFEQANAGHAAFLHAWLFSLLFFLMVRMSRRRTIWSAAFVGTGWGLTFLFAAYYGLLASVMVGVYFLYEAIRIHDWAERFWTVTLFCASLGVCLLMLVPGLAAYASHHHVVATSIANANNEAQRLGASLGEYLLPDHGHPVLGSITRSVGSHQDFVEGTLFFGLTTIALAIFGFYLLVKKRPETNLGENTHRGLVFAAILVPVAVYSSLKSVSHIFGMPFPALAWFVTHVTSYFRVYARFGVLVGLGLVVLAAPALQWLLTRRSRLRFLPIVALLLVAFELIPGPVKGWPAAQAPQYDRWLAAQPRGIVAHYPMITDQEPAFQLGEREIYWQMYAPQPLYNLFGAGTGDTRESAIRILSRYITDPGTPSILAAEDVRYIVIHDAVYRAQGQTPPAAPSSLELIKRFPNVRIYRLKPDTPKANLDELLEQEAPTVAEVEGLGAPSVTYNSGFSGSSGAMTVTTEGTVALESSDVNLKRGLLLVTATSRSGAARLQAIADGVVLGAWPIGTKPTNVSFGPLGISYPSTAIQLLATGGPVTIRSLNVQPWADYSDSLRAS